MFFNNLHLEQEYSKCVNFNIQIKINLFDVLQAIHINRSS